MSLFDLGTYGAELVLNDKGFSANMKKAEQQMQQTDKKSKAFATTLGNLATGAIAGLGIALVGAAGAFVKFSADAEKSLDKLQAQLGITEQQAQKLGDIAKEVWKKGFGESLDEVTQTIATIQQQMGDLADGELDKLSQSALTLKETFGAEVNETTRTASVLMKQFGINGQEAFDLITVGFQKGGNFSDELLDTMREYSPQFKDMGLNANQMLSMLIKGTEAGSWSFDKIGDSLKEFNLRALDGSKTTVEGFKAIGLDAEKMGSAIAKGGEEGQKAFQATVAGLANMKDPLKQQQAGVALFGR